MKDRAYHFVDQWSIQAPAELIDSLLLDVGKWPSWWPGLKSADIQKITNPKVGSRARMRWQAPVGYHLNIEVTITGYKPNYLIAFTSEGDLRGSGSWEFSRQGGRTHMTITWDVATTKRWMNILAPIAQPLFIGAHGIVMKQGERGLRKRLESLKGESQRS